MDEMRLRAVALALRSQLPELLVADAAAQLDAELTHALQRPPGRAADELQQVLWQAPEPVRAWVAGHVEQQWDGRRLRLRTDDSGPTGVDDHEPTVWLEERDDDDLDPLDEGASYVLVAMAGVEGPNARYADEVTTPAGPGLATTWVLSSTTVRFDPHPADSQVQVGVVEAGDRSQWQAVFPLLIPAEGDSVRHRVQITPMAAPDARLDVVVTVGDDIYRRIPVSFHVRPTPPRATTPAVEPEIVEPVSSVVVGRLAAAHVGLTPPADWQQPTRQMDIHVMGPSTMMTIKELGVLAAVDWATEAEIPSRIGNVRTALRRLREAHPEYFEHIDPHRLAADLRDATPARDWTAAPDPTTEDAAAWGGVAESEELFELAYHGYQLFRALFADPLLRNHLAALTPGDKVQINWLTEFSPAAPHLPLPLLYLAPVNPGQAIDPMQFLGLRHRLAYNRRQSTGSRALGEWHDTTRAHMLYWGDGSGDAVGAEAARHITELRQWEPLLLVPHGEPRITELERFLSAPEPQPVALLYFYCHGSDESGRNPALRFGPTNAADSMLRRSRMGSDLLVGEPIVFVNACGSSESDPLLVNQLMETFLDRGCRGYIGTEEQVPPGVAARFATAFFSFLYGTPTRSRAPVGEALAQARRFLWQRYRNLGGLFYSHINDYLVYASDEETVGGMRGCGPTETGMRP